MKWVNEWQMNFNIPKCNILQITTHHTTSIYTYQMNRIPLKSVEKVKYLGVFYYHGMIILTIFATHQIDYSVF